MSNSSTNDGSAAKAVLLALAAVLLVVVAVQNATVVPFKFLFWTFHISRILLILLAALCGFVIGLITRSLVKRKRK
jgi:uncharacterized integral membrane protein